MKTFTRWLLALLLVATPMMVAIQYAAANTELVPASRLVAPYLDIQTSPARNTFLLLTNVRLGTSAGVELRTTATGSVGGVHIEFYDKTCARSDSVIDMSPGDIDQIQVTLTNAPSLATSRTGFADIDVRSGAAQLGNTSTQQNTLTGIVLISDSTSDFAFSYPMAASVGSARTSQGGNIVTRNASGNAVTWTGRYEPFPNRLILPAFFAEGTDAGGPTTSTFLAIVSPALGNFNGSLNTIDDEGPGQDLTTLPFGGVLINAGAIMWDGCERNVSQPLSGHVVFGSLGSLFGTSRADRSLAPWTTANCSTVFPGRDEASASPVGWIDFPNGSTSSAVSSSALPAGRGLVGVFFESSVGGSPAIKQGDGQRLWGDPTTITSQSSCTTSDGTAIASPACRYNMFPVPSFP